MKLVILFSALLMTTQLYAQSTGSINIYKDPRIDVLLKKQAEANNLSTRNSAKRRTAKGYRLLIISSNNRNEAIAARTKLLTHFPELKAYMWYQAPYYKVKAGNFISRNDAQAYQKKLASIFPGNIFIMNDTVEVKPEETESSE
ncbi:hypothetical protein PIECOFPK_01533 [Mycovorax composti]|jgi:Sporulation related domain.